MVKFGDLHLDFDGNRFCLSNKRDPTGNLRLHAFGTRGQASIQEAQARFAFRVTEKRQWLQQHELSVVEAGEVDGQIFSKVFSHPFTSFMHSESSWNAVCSHMTSQLDGVGDLDHADVEPWNHAIDHFSSMAALMAAGIGCQVMIVVVEIGI